MADDIVLSSDGITSRRGLPVNFQTPPAVISGGSASGGIFRGHTIQFPWSYTQTTDPVDATVGTALFVDVDVTLASGGGFGPQFQSGYYGPRAVIHLEGSVRYGSNGSILALSPVGFGDFMVVANTAGVGPRDLAGGWPFLNGRGYVADGATVELVGTDVNDGGAGFVDSGTYSTVDGGTIDGTTNDYEHVSFLSMPGIGGNSAIERRVAFDVMPTFEGFHPDIPEPTGAHWSGLGEWDPTTPTLNEEIGLRIQEFTLGATKIGIKTAHPIRLMDTSLTHSSATVLSQIETPSGTTYTLQGSGTAGIRAWTFGPTVVFDDDANILGSALVQAAPIIKNVNGEARSLGSVFAWASVNSAPTFRGDGAAVTGGTVVAFRDAIVTDIANAGTLALGSVISFQSGGAIGAGVTVTTRKILDIADATGAGTLTTQIAIDIAALAKGGTNIGIRNASTEVATPSVQALSAVGNTITPNAKVKRLNNTSGGSLTLTSNPHISDGQDGQILILFNSSANDVVLTDGNGVQLGAATRTLGTRDSLMLLYSTDIGDWIELGFVNN